MKSRVSKWDNSTASFVSEIKFVYQNLQDSQYGALNWTVSKLAVERDCSKLDQY